MAPDDNVPGSVIVGDHSISTSRACLIRSLEEKRSTTKTNLSGGCHCQTEGSISNAAVPPGTT